jgi:hypothetical protein
MRLTTVKTIHDAKHIPESQISLCVCTTYAPSQHISTHYQTNDVGGHRGREVGVPEHLHAMYYDVRKEGSSDLYCSLGPSCIKLMSATGISLMWSEACKRILIEGEDDEEEIHDANDEDKKTP